MRKGRDLVWAVGGRDLIAVEAHYHQAYVEPKIVGKPVVTAEGDWDEKSEAGAMEQPTNED